MKKECPKCHRKYEGLENYCSKCGIELEKARNTCSEMKSTLCKHRILEADDIYCPYCGSLSTYGKEIINLKEN